MFGITFKLNKPGVQISIYCPSHVIVSIALGQFLLKLKLKGKYPRYIYPLIHYHFLLQNNRREKTDFL